MVCVCVCVLDAALAGCACIFIGRARSLPALRLQRLQDKELLRRATRPHVLRVCLMSLAGGRTGARQAPPFERMLADSIGRWRVPDPCPI